MTSDGFFLQEEDADVDADPATSEGIFVFTSSAPPAGGRVHGAGAGHRHGGGVRAEQPIRWTRRHAAHLADGRADRCRPDRRFRPRCPLTPTFPDPAGPFDQLERRRAHAGQRDLAHRDRTERRAASTRPTRPARATAASMASSPAWRGRSGKRASRRRTRLRPEASRPFRVGTPIPSASASRAQRLTGQPIITVKSGDVVGPLAGPLDYSCRSYALLPDGTSTPIVTPGTLATTVTSRGGERDDRGLGQPSSLLRHHRRSAYADAVLTPAAYDRRLAKASLAIRTHLRNPDIIGVQEVENPRRADRSGRAGFSRTADRTTARTSWRATIRAGLDVGFLVKTTPSPAACRASRSTSVTQVGGATTWLDPVDSQPAILNDRPPLVLEATVNRTSTASFPIVVVVTDLAGARPGSMTITPDGLTDRRRSRAPQAAGAGGVPRQLHPDASDGRPLPSISSSSAASTRSRCNDGYRRCDEHRWPARRRPTTRPSFQATAWTW